MLKKHFLIFQRKKYELALGTKKWLLSVDIFKVQGIDYQEEDTGSTLKRKMPAVIRTFTK